MYTSKQKSNNIQNDTHAEEERMVRKILKRLIILKSRILQCLEEVRDGILYVLGVNRKVFYSCSCCIKKRNDDSNAEAENEPFLCDHSFCNDLTSKYSQHSSSFSQPSPRLNIFERDVQPICSNRTPVLVLDNKYGFSDILVQQKHRISQVRTTAEIHNNAGNTDAKNANAERGHCSFEFVFHNQEPENYSQAISSEPIHIDVDLIEHKLFQQGQCLTFNSTDNGIHLEKMNKDESEYEESPEVTNLTSIGSGDNVQKVIIQADLQTEQYNRVVTPRKNTPTHTRHNRHSSSNSFKSKTESIKKATYVSKEKQQVQDHPVAVSVNSSPSLSNAVEEHIVTQGHADINLKNAIDSTHRQTTNDGVRESSDPAQLRIVERSRSSSSSSSSNQGTGFRIERNWPRGLSPCRSTNTDTNSKTEGTRSSVAKRDVRPKTSRKLKYPHRSVDKQITESTDRIIAHPGNRQNDERSNKSKDKKDTPNDMETTQPACSKSLSESVNISILKEHPEEAVLNSDNSEQGHHIFKFGNNISDKQTSWGFVINSSGNQENKMQSLDTIAQCTVPIVVKQASHELREKTAEPMQKNDQSCKQEPDQIHEKKINETNDSSRHLSEEEASGFDPQRKRRILSNLFRVFETYKAFFGKYIDSNPPTNELHRWGMVLTNSLLNISFMYKGSEDERIVYEEVVRLYAEVNYRLAFTALNTNNPDNAVEGNRENGDTERTASGTYHNDRANLQSTGNAGKLNTYSNGNLINDVMHQIGYTSAEKSKIEHNTPSAPVRLFDHSEDNKYPPAGPFRSWKLNRAAMNQKSNDRERRKLKPVRRTPASETGHDLQSTDSNLDNLAATNQSDSEADGEMQRQQNTGAVLKRQYVLPARLILKAKDNDVVPPVTTDCEQQNAYEDETELINFEAEEELINLEAEKQLTNREAEKERVNLEISRYLYENCSAMIRFIHLPSDEQRRQHDYEGDRERLSQHLEVHIRRKYKEQMEHSTSELNPSQSSDATSQAATEQVSVTQQTTCEQSAPPLSHNQATPEEQLLETEDVEPSFQITSTPKKYNRRRMRKNSSIIGNIQSDVKVTEDTEDTEAIPAYTEDLPVDDEGYLNLFNELLEDNSIIELLEDDSIYVGDDISETSTTGADCADDIFDMSEFFNFTSYLETNDATLDYNCLTVKPGHGGRPNRKKLAEGIREKIKTKGLPNKHIEQAKHKPTYDYQECIEDNALAADNSDGGIDTHISETLPEGAEGSGCLVTGGADLSATEMVPTLDDREYNMVPEEVLRKDDSKLKDLEDMYNVPGSDKKREKKKKKPKSPKRMLNLIYAFNDQPCRRF